jgi:hypothetical protein|tara:strand:- start:1413 stop:1571 length:159 start_codon:yes stop_codon:yes gene_type:complete
MFGGSKIKKLVFMSGKIVKKNIITINYIYNKNTTYLKREYLSLINKKYTICF